MHALPRSLALRACREVVDQARQRLLSDQPLSGDVDWVAQIVDRAHTLTRPRLRRVINATGIVLHTNLGRAPMAPSVAAKVAEVARSYSNLEMDLASGSRGGRLEGIQAPLCEITGAEAAIAVNNNAAAVLLALSALARGREVLVSRGELVEIGGSFRVPEVIADGGARLVEVGATNRTRVADYARAITEKTAMILRIHSSNFRMIGFTEQPARAELVALGREHNIPVVDDLGSGLLMGAPRMQRPIRTLEEEELVNLAVAAGTDVVCFSGDKLLGGPQAGLIVGRAPLIKKMRKHPLYRALRLDKLVLAALEGTLLLYRAGVHDANVPARAMLSRTESDCRAVAERMAAQIPGAEVIADVSYSGGGALPEEELPTAVVAVSVKRPSSVAKWLRGGEPPIVARVSGGRLCIDPRTLLDGDETVIVSRLQGRLGER